MIKSIRLLNWRSHHDTKLEFHKGTNLLVGIMGAGKSSVLEGISFALFGTMPALERRKIKLEDIVRLNESEAKVILEFEWIGVVYTIERTIERNKKGTSTRAEVYKNKALVESGQTAATSYLENLTNVDYDLFTRAIYSEQNNIGHFLNLDPRKRKEEIDALLGLDKFESARANIVSVMGRIHAKRQTVEIGFDKNQLNELKEKEKKHSEELEKTKKDLAGSLDAHGKLTTSLTAKTKEHDELRKKKEAHEKLSKEKIVLNTKQETLKTETKEIDEKVYLEVKTQIHQVQDEKIKTQMKLKTVEEQFSKASKETGSIDTLIKRAKENRTRLDATRKELKILLEKKTLEVLILTQKENEKKLIAIESDIKSTERESKELLESLEKLKPGMAHCPLCQSELDNQKINYLKLEKGKAIAETKKKIETLVLSRTQSTKQNQELFTLIKKAELLSERITTIEQEFKGTDQLELKKVEIEKISVELIKEKAEVSKKIEEITTNLEKLRAKSNEFENLLKKKKELENVEKRLSEVEEEITKTHFNELALETLRNDAENLRLETERSGMKTQTLTKEVRTMEEMLALIRNDIIRMEKTKREADYLAKLEEELMIYKNALIETQTSLRSTLIDAINTAINEIWNIVYPYKNYRALRLQVTDKDYLFEIDDRNGWKSLDSIASGGERASAALALRIALAMVLTPKLSWLILDEPTHNLDAQAVELLSNTLQTKIPEVVNQTFVITHDEGLMGSEFASSYKLGRNKENNGETKVEVI